MAESVARMWAVLPIKHVADYFGLGWDAVKKVDKTSLKRRLGASAQRSSAKGNARTRSAAPTSSAMRCPLQSRMRPYVSEPRRG
jgi:hypothetical protein